MATWNEAREEQMIIMIQERPALYDVTENVYANRTLRAQLWHEIESKLVISEKELRKRWESLRTQYTRYKKLPLGSVGAPKTGRQQWILSRLQFLEPHTKRKDTTSSLNVMEPLDTDDSSSLSTGTHEESSFFESEPKPNIPLLESTISEEESPAIKEEPLTYTFTQSRPRAKRSREVANESVSVDSTKLLRTIGTTLESFASLEDRDDEISTYCKSMEHRMRTLPPHLLPHFMHDVDNSIFKYQVLFSRTSCRENLPNTLPSEIHPLHPTSTNGNL
ncbi:uncharacterized protein LOC130548000 [Triplophysa rosa]|uniref:MADF domain-containing protein n=1 Tax=Triplophysa rosa TaxID=992332 RepID=A0A9W7T8B0_TRIRA|nr:uncharacterized protein LOC130548000 [Triplophysa rosa]KAI7791886.1 hypothetical protein IRJ41_013092 [Triplophysa rosa]